MRENEGERLRNHRRGRERTTGRGLHRSYEFLRRVLQSMAAVAKQGTAHFEATHHYIGSKLGLEAIILTGRPGRLQNSCTELH